MAADISAITYLAPIAVFLIVVSIVFAVLLKLKILGEHKVGLMFISFLIGTIFISTAGSISFIGSLTPAFAILIVSTAFLLILLGFIGKPVESFNKGIGIAVVVIFGIIFLFTAFVIYSKFIIGYLPGPMFGYNANPETLPFLQWFYSPRVLGAFLLIIASGVASWILVKAK